MNLYKMFNEKKLPEELQKETESFASQADSTGEELFRIGFYIGRNYDKYKDEFCKINGVSNDR